MTTLDATATDARHELAFEEACRSTFAFLKATTALDDLWAKSLRLPDATGYLLPVAELHRPALDGCADLDALLADPNRTGWLVADHSGAPVGVISCKARPAHREIACALGPTWPLGHPLVAPALARLAEWAHDELGPGHVVGPGGARLDPPVPAGPILTAGPSISARETSYALDAVRNGWNSSWSGYLDRFESAFASYIGVDHALATSSCTGALHLALGALGIGPGHEVVVPDITWVASAAAVRYVGATPVFADIEPDSWCLDPQSLAGAITSRTRAVVPVHLYGHPANMTEIMRIARSAGIAVVEDAAPAIGAECNGRMVGTFGDFAAFSFQGAKLLVTGEGGMLVTSDDHLHALAHHLWDQGRDPTQTFWIDQLGLKYKMANVQAAIGLGQLERVEAMIEAKRRIHRWYGEGLSGVAHVRVQHEAPWARSIMWMTNVLLEPTAPVDREELRARLKAQGIDTRPVFPTISQYPIWDRLQRPQPVAANVAARAINLPSGVRLRRAQVDRVCDAIRAVLGSW